MNCQTFLDLAGDIARDQMMDAAARTQALAHADGCVSCADRLRAQQQLTSHLRELVSATGDQTASAAVWERLSVAFDARTITHVKTSQRRAIYATAAIAAMLILAFAVVGLVRYRQPPNVQVSIAATLTAATPNQTTNQSREPDVSGRFNKKPQAVRHRLYPVPRGLTLPVNQPKEIATDFILLTYDQSEVGSDAQLVRVELPRSAMANFGLPVNMDRADERVKADVLLSADGLARAIRFVQ